MSEDLTLSYTKECGEYLSADKRTAVKYMLFTPNQTPRGIIQALHGLGSSICRYEASGFVEKLTSAGYVVCGEDHLGHGGSIASEEDRGHIDKFEYLIEDIHTLRKIVRERYKHLPYIMYGHSFGSMILRGYISKYDDIDGAVIAGTCASSKRFRKMRMKCSRIALLRGLKHRSKKLDKGLFDGFNDSFADENDVFSWLCSLSKVRELYRSKGGVGMSMTVGGYREFFRLGEHVTSREWAGKVSPSLPILIISGSDDPFGGMGEGIKELYSWLCDRELSSLKMKLYDGARHEILKDFCRKEVFSDIIEWSGKVVQGTVESKVFSMTV